MFNLLSWQIYLHNVKTGKVSKVVVFVWLNSGKMWLNFMIIEHLSVPLIGVLVLSAEYKKKAYVIH